MFAMLRRMARATYGEGSVNQVGPGRFQLRWSEGVDPWTGKHVRRSTTVDAKNLTDARRQLRALVAKGGRASRLTIGELLDVALPALPKATDRTREAYRFALTNFPPAARDWPAADLTIVQARQIIEGLTERCGPWTVRKIHAALMSCWREAQLNGWVESNPWRGQRLPTVEASAGEVLTDAEVERLRAACADDLERLVVELHLQTGARPGEVLALRWSDIDADDRVITFTDAKHGGARRPVAVPADLIDRISAWQTRQRERALAAGHGRLDDAFLVSSATDSATPWRVAYAGSFRWPKLRERAGLRAGLRLYDLRHTHNSWLAADGIDEVTRAERIGNSPATNARTYSHSMRDREAAEAVAKRLG